MPLAHQSPSELTTPSSLAYSGITMRSEPSNDDTSHYEGALLEDIQDRIRLLAEAMADVPATVRRLDENVHKSSMI